MRKVITSIGGLLVLTAMVFAPVVARAGTVDWTAFGAVLTLTNNTTAAPVGSTVKLGVFNLTDAQILAAHNIGDIAALSAGFSQFDIGAVGDVGLGLPGVWGLTKTVDFTTTALSFAGKTIYLWATASGQEAIVKFATVFPTDVPVAGAASVDLSDVYSNASLLVGALGTGTIDVGFGPLPKVNMSVIIPEPSSIMLVVLGLVGLRRR